MPHNSKSWRVEFFNRQEELIHTLIVLDKTELQAVCSADKHAKKYYKDQWVSSTVTEIEEESCNEKRSN